jgi:hypothetical protein
MATSEEGNGKETKGWFATVKKLIGVLFWICVVAVVIAMFVFGDAIVGVR